VSPKSSRLAIVGDIHARGAALVAVIDAIRDAGIKRGICTGDVVMRGPDPAGCIAILRELGWPVVAGNTDRKVVSGDPRPHEHPASSRVGSRSWTYRALDRADLEWLAALPGEAHLDLGRARVVVTHGDADSVSGAVTARTPDRDIERLLRKLDADVLVIGHTHEAMIRSVRNGIVLNPGAVGESRTPDHQPHWAWLEATRDGVTAHLEVIATPLAPQREDGPED
jgi:putative phosphoesterase